MPAGVLLAPAALHSASFRGRCVRRCARNVEEKTSYWDAKSGGEMARRSFAGSLANPLGQRAAGGLGGGAHGRCPAFGMKHLTLDLNASRYGRIVQAVCSGGVARVLASAITLVSLPLAVRYLGAERYGVWATITTTAVWINLLDLGIASTLTNHISRAFALGDKTSATRYFT